MKLKNKKTGEILLIGNIIVENPKKIGCGELTKYSSLAELNDEWEDYKPKAFYYINENGGVLQYIPSDPGGEDEAYIKYQKAIGNYFESKEEAKKAVEKLKIYNKLKQKGFVFSGWYYSTEGQLVILADNHEFSETEPEDLTELFGDKIC